MNVDGPIDRLSQVNSHESWDDKNSLNIFASETELLSDDSWLNTHDSPVVPLHSANETLKCRRVGFLDEPFTRAQKALSDVFQTEFLRQLPYSIIGNLRSG